MNPITPCDGYSRQLRDRHWTDPDRRPHRSVRRRHLIVGRACPQVMVDPAEGTFNLEKRVLMADAVAEGPVLETPGRMAEPTRGSGSKGLESATCGVTGAITASGHEGLSDIMSLRRRCQNTS